MTVCNATVGNLSSLLLRKLESQQHGWRGGWQRDSAESGLVTCSRHGSWLEVSLPERNWGQADERCQWLHYAALSIKGGNDIVEEETESAITACRA